MFINIDGNVAILFIDHVQSLAESQYMQNL